MTNPSRGELVPGGLAMVIGLKRATHYNGVVCKTIKVMNPGDNYPLVSGFRIVHSGTGESGWICFSGSFYDQENSPASGYELFRARNLMPITPEPDPIEINSEEQQEQSA